MATPDINQELAQIPFDDILGGPLRAVIKAQNEAAMNTVDFIKEVGFEKGPAAGGAGLPPMGGGGMMNPMGMLGSLMQPSGRAATVTFQYDKTLPNGQPGVARLTVPFLCMIPIPNLRIEELSIELNVKIDAEESSTRDSSTTNVTQWEGKARRTKWNGLVVNTKTTKSGIEIRRNYSLNIKLKAVQDQMPAGLDRLLTILESSIKEVNKQAKEMKEKMDTDAAAKAQAETDAAAAKS
mmetsp:Transcript_28400/g.71318  ORF Transcript_28400/g.71318 Transcript_28400/m.71318 type:complete len:238 (-) Transcript_28400:143-856(-)